MKRELTARLDYTDIDAVAKRRRAAEELRAVAAKPSHAPQIVRPLTNEVDKSSNEPPMCRLSRFLQHRLGRNPAKEDFPREIEAVDGTFRVTLTLRCLGGEAYMAEATSAREATAEAARQALAAHEVDLPESLREPHSVVLPGPAENKDPKSELSIWLSKVWRKAPQKGQVAYVTDSTCNGGRTHFRSTISIDGMVDELGQNRWVGCPCSNKHLSEQDATARALQMLQPMPEHAAAVQRSETAASKKTLVKLAKSLANDDVSMQADDFQYQTSPADGGGYVCTIVAHALVDDDGIFGKLWMGDICDSEEKAEQSAAEAAMIALGSSLQEERAKTRDKWANAKCKKKSVSVQIAPIED